MDGTAAAAYFNASLKSFATTIPLTACLGSASFFPTHPIYRRICAIAGSTTDPAAALEFLSREPVDVLFLDIQMPGMNGFELLARLPDQPSVIFTTAYDQYALKAFEVNSIDYLLKPVDPEQLERALRKLERFRGAAKPELRTPRAGAHTPWITRLLNWRASSTLNVSCGFIAQSC